MIEKHIVKESLLFSILGKLQSVLLTLFILQYYSYLYFRDSLI